MDRRRAEGPIIEAFEAVEEGKRLAGHGESF